jgi:phage-related protein
MIWHALVTAFDAVVGAFKTLWEWIKSLPGLIWEGIKALPGLMAQLGTMLYNGVLYAIGWIAGVLVKFWTVDFPGWVRQAWDWVVQTTITGITNLGNWIASLPGLIWGAITEFGTIIINAVRDAWNWAVSYTEEGARRTWDRISALPGQIGSALSNLWDAIAGWFSRTWTAAVDATRKGVDDALTWIRGLPGRIQSALSGAGSWLVDVGRDMLRGLVDGIGDLLNWAVDAARNAAKKIADGFKHGLESHSPSQLMRREVGRWILPGIVQGMEDTQPKFDDYLGASANMIADAYRPVVNVGSPSVSVGGVTLIADLGEGIRKVVPVQILRHAETVATAANIGNRGRAAWTNTGRTVITGS